MKKNSGFKWISLLVLVSILAGWYLLSAKSVQAGSSNSQTVVDTGEVITQDDLLMQGWNYLDTLDDPISLWNGRTLTGKDLAQFVKQNRIPVVWGSADICNGSSCSKLYCSMDGQCEYEDGQAGVDPIYINAGARDQLAGQKARIAAEIAHEGFHRMRLFGKVKATQIEEYWAFYIDAQISKASWPKFNGVEPMDESQLEHWFSMHMMRGYLKLDAYPAGFNYQSSGIKQNESSNLFVTEEAKKHWLLIRYKSDCGLRPHNHFYIGNLVNYFVTTQL